MKFIEIRGSILQPISNEETLLLEKVKGSIEPTLKQDLNEREREVARNLVNRGILTRLRLNNKLCFLPSELQDNWES